MCLRYLVCSPFWWGCDELIGKGCREKGKHREGDETFCTLDAFKEIVEKVRPVNWKEECRVRGFCPLQVGKLIVFRSGEGAQVSSWRSSVIYPMCIYTDHWNLKIAL